MNLEQFFKRFSAAAAALSGRQIATLTIAFVAVVSLTIGSAYWLNIPTYGVLFSDMDPESAAAVVTKLKSAKVLYTLDDGGRTIRVPTDRVNDLRLEYAANGMPGGGHVGFELFDRTSFGVTDFLEHVNYRRALEGELARTISSIAEVAGARVHIAIPQPSLFIGREQPTKASVILKLRGNRQLSADTVKGITGFVSSAVESLRPESVVIIDNFGRPLSRPQDAGEMQGVPLERQQQIERDLSMRVMAMIDPIVGPGHARVNVSARLNPDTAEETEERWGPTAIRSQESVSLGGAPVPGTPGVAGAEPGVVGGVAGARGNLPPPEVEKPDPEEEEDPASSPDETKADAPRLAGGRNEERTNYEVNKLTRHSVRPRGEIMRLSVAVVVDENRSPAAAAADAAPDGSAPDVPTSARAWAPADIQKIHDVVAAAVGIDPERGDQLTVETIAFEEAPIEPVIEPGAWQRFGPQVFEALRILGIVALAAFALFGVIRPLVKTSLTATPGAVLAKRSVVQTAVTGGQPRTVGDIEAEMDAQLLNAPDALRVPAMTRRMAALTQKEPENAARLLRTWLTEDR